MLLKAVCTACQWNGKSIIIRPILSSAQNQLAFHPTTATSIYYSTSNRLREQVTSAKLNAKPKIAIDEAFIINNNDGVPTSTTVGPGTGVFDLVQKSAQPSLNTHPSLTATITPRNEFTTKISADCLTPSQISITKTPLKLVNALEGSIIHRKKLELSDIPGYYLSLSKARLSSLVVITSMAGYALAPVAFNPEIFLYLSIGTALTSASANCINQMVEVPYDSKMDRTKNRVLVNELLSIPHALAFALVTAGTGVTTLYLGANELTAVLGAANLFLYTSVYTPLKRQSILNTWVGSVVGAIPPLMGWAAATGSLDSTSLIIAGVLYAWQFVHFNSLSWNLKNDYKRGGYRMMSVTHPDLCRRTALRYSLSLFALCTLAPVMELTSWTFAFDSIPLNGYLTYLAWKFYQQADSSSSRKLFRFSLIHLPALIILMLISKKWSSQKSTNKQLPISET